ncbi:glutamate ABC transporter substrate-binding protein [Litorihabitans aurantiacus]|uniref:ABC transporter substrate-binding protein n=1 Tax=Litorihabitans aurantiacus TaxID=1930061 RepID=A0AA37ULH2_9MICO|nr:glutamate ABC transporter substrate-binding protein [Litorihabitans aurantiacus]GMA30199.1 ABC transporter substrate-binding protein [Litorihabitans aurantiacus]
MRTRRHPGPNAAIAAVATVAALTLAACTGPSGLDDLGREAPPTAEATDAPVTPAPPAPATCDDATTSYDPLPQLPDPGTFASGSTMQQIQDRGTLVAGISADTLLMSSRNPLTGEIEGFDIDVLRDLSTAIFGEPDRVQFRVITSGERVGVLEGSEVDVVARTFSMTCQRWESIAFSAEYYGAGQKVLVSAESDAESLEDLAGQRVCAPEGTTTLQRLEDYDVEAVPARTHTACLVLFQRSQVEAITGDDTILAGFAAQDPYAKVVGEAISAEPYGLGFPAASVDLVQLANTVLAQRVADGRWQASYDRWLSVLGTETTPPTPVYGRAS